MDFDYDFLDEVFCGSLSILMDSYQFEDEPEISAVQIG